MLATLTVLAHTVPAGTVLNADPLSCGHLLTVQDTVPATDPRYGERTVVSIGCPCGSMGRATMPLGSVLTLTGTLALF